MIYMNCSVSAVKEYLCLLVECVEIVYVKSWKLLNFLSVSTCLYCICG